MKKSAFFFSFLIAMSLVLSSCSKEKYAELNVDIKGSSLHLNSTMSKGEIASLDKTNQFDDALVAIYPSYDFPAYVKDVPLWFFKEPKALKLLKKAIENPGNPVAYEHVYSIEEIPTTWQGPTVWKNLLYCTFITSSREISFDRETANISVMPEYEPSNEKKTLILAPIKLLILILIIINCIQFVKEWKRYKEGEDKPLGTVLAIAYLLPTAIIFTITSVLGSGVSSQEIVSVILATLLVLVITLIIMAFPLYLAFDWIRIIMKAKKEAKEKTEETVG